MHWLTAASELRRARQPGVLVTVIALAVLGGVPTVWSKATGDGTTSMESVAVLLVSPDFLFRVEQDPPGVLPVSTS